jgi:uncharacterized protein (TIGR02594 family)
VCSAALVVMGGPAFAKRIHRAVHRHMAVQAMVNDVSRDGVVGSRYQALAAPAAAPAKVHRRHRVASMPASEVSTTADVGTDSLVAEARKYIGTNPTGRGSLWCGAFMDMVLKRTGHAGGGNLALGYEHYGTRVSGPQIGAIAVMGRHGGGHVGVVSGIDGKGNPIIVSGNHNNTVAESVYPRSRIAAYVVPGG